MTAPPPGQPPVSPTQWSGVVEDRVERLSAWLAEHSETYTPEALRTAAEDGGFTGDEIDAAVESAERRRDNLRAAGPLRTRARVIVLGAYVLVYAGLAWALLSAPNLDDYGSGEIALVVLTIVLGVSLLTSLAWVGRRGRAPARLEGALVAILVLPLILLGAVAGLCVVTTQPFGVN